jgi:hypothetical protein
MFLLILEYTISSWAPMLRQVSATQRLQNGEDSASQNQPTLHLHLQDESRLPRVSLPPICTPCFFQRQNHLKDKKQHRDPAWHYQNQRKDQDSSEAGMHLVVQLFIWLLGKFHDQGDAKWIVIRGQLRGHNDTPCGRPTPSRPISHPVVGRPQGVIGGCETYVCETYVSLYTYRIC